MDNNPVINILPRNRKIQAVKGQSLLETLIHNGIFLRSDCGGRGTCGKCRVKIISDGSFKFIESCQLRMETDITIEIPDDSILTSHIMTKAPVVLPESFKNKFSPSNDSESFGIAVDLGTTTIAVYLCDINTAEVLSSVAVKNPQAMYGDDVMSRISVIDQNKSNLKKLQTLVAKSIEWGMKELIKGITKDTPLIVSSMVVVGNPTMIHILAGVDPKPIGISPYLPAFFDATLFSATDMGLEDPDLKVQTLPQISGFIGGDILSAALAVDIENQPDGTLLVDLGTNGELLFKADGHIYGTSCATGPAFEGASISCGMQAIPGAVNKVSIDDNGEFKISVIQGKDNSKKPSGICGAGVISIIAQFCKNKLIESSGRIANGEEKIVIVPEDKVSGQQSVHISQKDIRSVQLGKSALYSGIEFLIKKTGFKMPEKIILAGAFGTHLDKSDMLRIGLLPNIDPDKISVAGNAAGTGAVMTLCDQSFVGTASEMASKIEIINLAADKEFQEVFINNLSFPVDI